MVRGGSAARREASDRPPCAVEVAAGDADDDGAVLAADARPGSLASAFALTFKHCSNTLFEHVIHEVFKCLNTSSDWC